MLLFAQNIFVFVHSQRNIKLRLLVTILNFVLTLHFKTLKYCKVQYYNYYVVLTRRVARNSQWGAVLGV